MITFFTGFPRTGKSYRGVWFIKNNFLDPQSKHFNKYQFCYTNIGGFKFDQINNDLIAYPLDPSQSDFFKLNPDLIKEDEDFTKEAIYLDWNKFYPHIQKMYEMAMVDKPDEEILRYARYHKLSPALLVIDEAYRFYKKKADPVLVWLNGYHGHLGLDIIFIVHRATLMASDYAVHTEEFVNAQAKSKQLNNNTLTYLYYDTPTATKHYHKEKLTADPDIFALYKSGDLHKPKKIIYKFIVYIVMAVLIIAFLAYLFYSRMNDRIHPDTPHDVNNASVNNSSTVSNSSIPLSSDKLPIIVRCDRDSCTRVDPSFQTKYIPRIYFDELLRKTDSTLLTVKEKYVFDITYYDYLILVSADSMRLFPFWTIPAISNYSSAPASVSSTPLEGVTQ
ncbi:MAG: zonular occludens toxin domain-containing protein [Sulfuricurvum sp.]|uniref:zonular occludens toxin domain-containing protein n=1 Tax=Sulfuricurvum sp. TaxID=2025608 RepID=UPI0035689700